MNFSSVLVMWAIMSGAGLIGSGLTMQLEGKVLGLNRTANRPDVVIANIKHLRTMTGMLAAGWLGFLLIGLLATTVSAPPNPLGETAIGLLIRWGLLGVVALWAFMTVADYVYLRGLYDKSLAAAQAPAEVDL